VPPRGSVVGAPPRATGSRRGRLETTSSHPLLRGGTADSAETDAENAEELFEQQQSEVEDLLGAALNLNMQEAFLDVHYRSRDEALIGFSNEQFYGTRLKPFPGHPNNKALNAPVRIQRVPGIYENRSNRADAEKVVELVMNCSPTRSRLPSASRVSTCRSAT
jgi:hypothetical protein